MEKDAPAEEQRNVSLVPNWEGLAQEMVVEILSFLPWYDLLTCKLVCKNWQSLIRDFDSLWINHCNAWGLSMSPVVPTNSPSSPSNPSENQPQSAFKIFQSAMDALLHQADPPPLYYRGQHEESTSSDSSSEEESYSSSDDGGRPIKAISRKREEKKESVRAGKHTYTIHNTHSHALRPTNSA